MICELVVTSAPRGLLAGRSGFTTVLRTRGIHPDLATRLEAASAYRHVHPQGDPRNPVIFCYALRPSAVGESWVMSRIGDAGTDYTGRSNKIAHHVALHATDLAGVMASNPAGVMAALAASHGLLARWDGEPRETPVPPVLPLPPSAPAMCQRWAAIAGDAGWAGVLVERALNREVTWVIAPPGVDLLPLYAEALALVSPGQRWQIPFTTYSLRGDEGRWLGTTTGSPEAVAALGQSRGMVIDLTRRGRTASAGPYVQAARGECAVPWQRPASAPGLKGPATAPAVTASPVATAAVSGSGTGSVSGGLPPMLRSPHRIGAGADDEWEEVPIDRPRTGQRWLITVAVIAALGIVGTGTGYVAYVLSQPANEITDGVANDKLDQANENHCPKDPATSQPQAAGSSLATNATPVESVPDPTRQAAASNEASVESASVMKPESAVIDASRRPGHQDELTAADILAEAKKPGEKGPAAGIPAFDEAGSAVTLVSWGRSAALDEIGKIDLSLPSLADMPSDYQLVLKKNDAESGAVTWQCGTAGRPAGVGTFTLTGTALMFAYAAESTAGHDLLPFVPVRMSESGTSGKYLVIEPPLLASGSFSVHEDAAVVVLPQAAALSPEACSVLSGRLRIADATLGLGFSPDVVIEAAAMGDKPRFAGGASLPVTEGPVMQVWWRPAIGAGSAADVREPLAIRAELQSGADDGEASARGMRIVMRLDQRIADPMPAVLAKLSPGAAQNLRLFLTSADSAARVGAAGNVSPADVVQWLAMFAFQAKAADDPPYGELRKWLKNRSQKRQGERENIPKSKAESSPYADVVNAIKFFIQERDAYGSHVDHAVEAALAKDWPAGRPPAPGKLPEPPRPGDAADKQRYDREIAAWRKQDGQARAYAEQRDRLDSQVRADTADFRIWVQGIVTPANGAGHQNEAAADVDRRLAELWQMLHVYGLLRQGGLPVPTAAVNEPRDAAAQAGCLHVNRFKGLVQLRWEFGIDNATPDETIFTTLAELDLPTEGEMRRPRTGSLSAVRRPMLARAILSKDKVIGFVTTAVSLRPGVSPCH